MLSATVIVPTYNRPDALARTLDALLAMDFPRDQYEIVVVDTGRSESGAEQVSAVRGIRYLPQGDVGVAGARNRGADLATGELLFFVDDDTVVEKSNLSQHEAIQRDGERLLVYGHRELDSAVRAAWKATPFGRYRLAYEDRYNGPDGVGWLRAKGGRVYPLTLAAGHLSVRRNVFEALGGFDERFPVGAEDQDFTWRARRAGCTLMYDYNICAFHNDQHRDLSELCHRVERAAVGTVYFSYRNPDAPRPSMLDLNGPIQRGDSPRLLARKLTRSVLSQRFSLLLVERLVRLGEKVMPRGGSLLEWLYNALDGLYVFRGVRRGLRMTSEVSLPPAHQRLLERV
jgi:GT2 family glycosyltransferase